MINSWRNTTLDHVHIKPLIIRLSICDACMSALPYDGILNWCLCSALHEYSSPHWSIVVDYILLNTSIIVLIDQQLQSTVVRLCSAQYEHSSSHWSTVVQICSAQHKHNSPYWSMTIRWQVRQASTTKHCWSSNRHIRSWLGVLLGT